MFLISFILLNNKIMKSILMILLICPSQRAKKEANTKIIKNQQKASNNIKMDPKMVLMTSKIYLNTKVIQMIVCFNLKYKKLIILIQAKLKIIAARQNFSKRALKIMIKLAKIKRNSKSPQTIFIRRTICRFKRTKTNLIIIIIKNKLKQLT